MRAPRAVAALAAGGAVVVAIVLRRRAPSARERVDLYLADGTKLTLAAGTPEFDRLAPLAHDVLRATGVHGAGAETV